MVTVNALLALLLSEGWPLLLVAAVALVLWVLGPHGMGYLSEL